jgi:hypothetical protein
MSGRVDRGNAEARTRIEKAKGLLAERQRHLDLEAAEAGRLFQAGEVELARSALKAVLAIDSGHVEARELQSRIEALDRRNEVPREGVKLPDPPAVPAPPASRRVVLRVPRRRRSSRPTGRPATSPVKMLAFLFGSLLLFGAAAYYLHQNWDLLVSDGAFDHPAEIGSPLVPAREIGSLPDRSELRYFNGARLFAEGRYREALSELSRVDPRSPVMADARSLILRIEERLLRGAAETELSGER